MSATALEALEGSLSRSDVVLEIIEETIVAAIAKDNSRTCQQRAPDKPDKPGKTKETEAIENVGLDTRLGTHYGTRYKTLLRCCRCR